VCATTWDEQLAPRIVDRDGSALVVSTPHGRGWFHAQCKLGQRPNVWEHAAEVYGEEERADPAGGTPHSGTTARIVAAIKRVGCDPPDHPLLIPIGAFMEARERTRKQIQQVPANEHDPRSVLRQDQRLLPLREMRPYLCQPGSRSDGSPNMPMMPR
jgi:hypothetical protein